MRLLLIEDNPGDARLISEYLAEAAPGAFDVETHGSLRDGIAAIETATPDVVLLDLSLPDSSGYSTFEAVHARRPETPIIVVTGLADSETGIRAVSAGAQDYLIKGEFNGPQLDRAIRYAVGRTKRIAEEIQRLSGASSRDPGRVAAFVGVTGGVGTTTVVLNVAEVLAREAPTAAIEMMPFPGAFSSLLGIAQEAGLEELLRLPARELSDEAVLGHFALTANGVRLMCSSRSSEVREIAAEHVQLIVEAARGAFRTTLLDVSHHPFTTTQAALATADTVLMVTGREPHCLTEVKRMHKCLEEWGMLSKLAGGLIVNRSALNNPVDISEMTAALRCPVVISVPPAADELVAAEQRGSTLVSVFPDIPAAISLRDVALSVIAAPVAVGRSGR